MKKKRKFFVALIVATFIFSHCSDSNTQFTPVNQEKIDIGKKSQAEQYAYLEKNLLTLQRAFLPQTQNQDFKNLLYNEVEKMFDGDENVLLERLFEVNKDLLPQISQSRYLTATDKVDQSLDAFKNLESSQERFDLFPQIYIHNYFNLKEKGLSQNPVIVVYKGDKREILEGLRLNSKGETERIQVDESFASQNEVWVLSLNENYDGEAYENFVAKAKISNGRTKYTGACISTPNCLRDNTEWTDMEMNTFMISCRKETWAAGNSDVSITRMTAFENFIHPVWEQYWAPHWLGDAGGYDIN